MSQDKIKASAQRTQEQTGTHLPKAQEHSSREDQNSAEQQAYEASIQYIKNLTKFGINLGLERIKTLLQRLGAPQESLKVIHIGGTNGKGSTAAILQAILQEAGYKVGMFTSPHLHSYRERISVNGMLISCREVVDGLATMRPILDAMVAEGVEQPTEFEVSTALAFLYFARKQPDFVILEVGLGGEIDSTNVITPLISVLTSISMDHMDYLGDSLEKIARVKAGIIKEGVPVVTSVDKLEVLEVIEQQAAMKGARLIKTGQDVTWHKSLAGVNREFNSFNYHGLEKDYEELEISLVGEHQFSNACTALAVCELLQGDYSVRILEKAIREGLKNVNWPGRLELICREPKILLDAAHNADGMKALAQALTDYADGLYRRNKLVLCLGMLSDKEIDKAVQIIAPLASEIIVTKPDSPRAREWEKVAGEARKYLAKDKVHSVEDPVAALEESLKRLGPKDLLCVTGSLYMLAPVRQYLLEKVIADNE